MKNPIPQIVMQSLYRKFLFVLSLIILFSCSLSEDNRKHRSEILSVRKEGLSEKSYFGTLEPFASEAVYFLMTDRFVDGDPSNNYPDQGGVYPTFRLPLLSNDGREAYVGYMGGDFQGIVNNADYIHDMGFTAIWLSPIVDNPDQSFTGGEPIEFGGQFKDGGKSGYHGYWGNNFFVEDEHWVSENLNFKSLNKKLKEKQLKTVLDIVLNHGTPSFSMPVDQEKFGELYDGSGRLVADHQNLEPEQLTPEQEPLHRFFHMEKDIMQLSNFNGSNESVMNYFVDAYLHWIDQGVDALRIDTVKHMPHSVWKVFADRIRQKYPDFYMFGESYSFDANFIAQHTLEKNGSMNVLDFPGKQAIAEVFENKDSDFNALLSYLHLTHGPYKNPYDLAIFYDNHDMARMNADDQGFIDAHNWLFTSRGIPVVYYGSEIAFMAGTKEHEGNRNYYGQSNIDNAISSPVYRALKKIAHVRKNNIALQKGLQLNLPFSKHQASFFRIYQHEGVSQIALVLLNKSDHDHSFTVQKLLNHGSWKNAMTGETRRINSLSQALVSTVKAHGVDVWLFNGPVNHPSLIEKLDDLMRNK